MLFIYFMKRSSNLELGRAICNVSVEIFNHVAVPRSKLEIKCLKNMLLGHTYESDASSFLA